MSLPQLAACARCDKRDCSAMVIITAVRDEMKTVEHDKLSLRLCCPACNRFFSVLFSKLEYHEVTDDELLRGFISV